MINPIWHMGWGFLSSYQLYCNKNFCTIVTLSGQIWIRFLQRVIMYDLFVEGRYNIFEHIWKIFYLHFAETLLHTHINGLLLIPDLFVRPMMTCLWYYYCLNDVLWSLNKGFLPYKVNYDIISREPWVDS